MRDLLRQVKQVGKGKFEQGMVGDEETSSDEIRGEGATTSTSTNDLTMVDRQTYADDNTRGTYKQHIGKNSERLTSEMHHDDKDADHYDAFEGAAGGELEMDGNDEVGSFQSGGGNIGSATTSMQSDDPRRMSNEGLVGEGHVVESQHDTFSTRTKHRIGNSGRERAGRDGDLARNDLSLPQNAGTNGQHALHGQAQHGQHAHRHELPERSQYATHLVGILIWVLVIVHLLAVAVWLRAWWRQKRSSKDPTMRSLIPPPPQKVTCSYDMDKAFSMPKIELANLPIKALALKKSKA